MLAIIQEKVNNPSPDDPFEPEIAAVILPSSLLLNTPLIGPAAAKERQSKVPRDRPGTYEEVSRFHPFKTRH